jgi:23S rRNA (pseudouridine1915-N3)-methyltransferase
MNIHLIAIGRKMPAWVSQGFNEYARRLPADYQLKLTEIGAKTRSKTADLKRIKEQEGQLLLAAVPNDAVIIALDEGGKSWTTADLAGYLMEWRQQNMDIALLVGGPEGLSDQCRQRAQFVWSLSALTLPHPLVRVLLAEQLYRAWSINVGHPYHRD